MELDRITLPPITAPGEVTTFYSFESGTARSVALSNMAVLLAGRQNATVPVLMIDWDTEAPGLHHFFEQRTDKPGLLEYFQACRDHLRLLADGALGTDPDALATHVLESIDWEQYVERVDQSRPLYLMRAGRFDDSYGERAHGMDWDGLFAACPALFRAFGDFMASKFRHVLIDSRSGRSAAVSICTALLPRKLVGLFTPNQRSLEGLGGVVTRAIDYRCSHEEAQRPLMVYPLPALVDSADCERRMQWRHGDPQRGTAGYQPVLERLLGQTYGLPQLSLGSYLDEVQLQQTASMAGGAPLPRTRQGADRFSLERTFAVLLDWMGEDRFPWQSRTEIGLVGAVSVWRAQAGGQPSAPSLLPLARDLLRLGALYRDSGREVQARACFEESLSLRHKLLGAGHADTRASCASLAALLRDSGELRDAHGMYELLARDCERLLGEHCAETLAVQSGLAATLALEGEFERALALHNKISASCEEVFGSDHVMTLDSYAGQARTLARHHELSRARMLYELVLDGRQRLLGHEHEDTLRCAQELAVLLSELGDMANARKLQQGVVTARLRHAGPDHAATVSAREALAEILAGLGEIAGVRALQEELAKTRERSLGSEHPETLSIQLRLATTLGMDGDLDGACTLQQRVVALQERLYGADSPQTLHSKKMLANTLREQGHTLDARLLEESAARPADRQLLAPRGAAAAPRGMASGPHASHDDHHFAPASAGGDGIAFPHAETLDDKLHQLQQLIDSRSDGEARELADSLRKSVLRPSVAHPLRKRGVAMIRKVYARDGDKDALLAFFLDEVTLLEGHLNQASGGRAVITG